MLSPISMQSMPVQHAQPVQAKPAGSARSSGAPSASLQPDTVSLSSQAHAAASHEAMATTTATKVANRASFLPLNGPAFAAKGEVVGFYAVFSWSPPYQSGVYSVDFLLDFLPEDSS